MSAERDLPGASDLVEWGAVDLANAIRSRRVSCREVLGAYLDRIDRLNPAANAIISLRDRGDLIREAEERDARLARGEYLGPLHGFPQAIKDLMPVRGLRTTLGSPIFRENLPAEDGIVAERIRRAGAVIIGKTNTPEFGLGSNTYNQVFGITRNAYDSARTAGGSSGGAAVALALRMLPVADGSDMGGSLRNPAAYNNLLGFRPSQGRVPKGPAAEVWVAQLGVEGPLGRSVPDLALLLSVLAGYDARAPLSRTEDPALFAGPLEADLRGTRLAWLGDWGGYYPMEDGVLDLCRSALPAFEAIGCAVEEAAPDFPPDRIWATWRTLRHWLTAGSLLDLYRDPAKRALMKPEAVWEVEGGLGLSAVEVYQASVARSAWYQALRRFFETYDFLLLPTAQVFPYDATSDWPKAIAGRTMDTYHRWMEVAIPATLAGCPAISVPAGFNAAGLPMGLQIVGRAGADLAVLRLAQAYDQATGWTRRVRPPILATETHAESGRT